MVWRHNVCRFCRQKLFCWQRARAQCLTTSTSPTRLPFVISIRRSTVESIERKHNRAVRRIDASRQTQAEYIRVCFSGVDLVYLQDKSIMQMPHNVGGTRSHRRRPRFRWQPDVVASSSPSKID